jgi:hypothetical protein
MNILDREVVLELFRNYTLLFKSLHLVLPSR